MRLSAARLSHTAHKCARPHLCHCEPCRKIKQQARSVTNAYMRIHAPAKVSKKPNFANLADVETATSKWEQSQRSLYLRHLEREQQPAGSSAPAGRVAFPSQLVHDLNELRRRAAASRATSSGATAACAPGAVDSRITPDGSGSVGSSEQVRCGWGYMWRRWRFCMDGGLPDLPPQP